jgi:AraC family transcriptional regulator, transcriptional activator FtrA
MGFTYSGVNDNLPSHYAMLDKRKKHRVVALAYDGLCTFEFGCAVEIFSLERPELEVDWYEFSVCADQTSPLRAAGGITISVPYSLARLDRADTIVIPGWSNANDVPPEYLLKKLRAAYKRGARICTICSGVFVLAATGLLDGKSATTHWRYESLLKEKYPLINAKVNALYVDEGQLLTSAGSAAGLDMMLHLVERDYGAKIANQVAQRLVIPTHRVGDQAQFVARAVPVADAARLSKLMEWVSSHPAANHTLASLAKRAAMSTRTLQRHFNDAVGLSPLEWLIKERVSFAKQMLESTQLAIVRVGELAGFGSEEAFRRHFKQLSGVTPAAYRKHFGTVTNFVAVR